MTSWEYQVIEAVRCDYKCDYLLSVMEINNEVAGELIRKGRGLFGSNEYDHPDLYSYLNSVGKEGWEVVGVSPTTGAGDTGGKIKFVIILKRVIGSPD